MRTCLLLERRRRHGEVCRGGRRGRSGADRPNARSQLVGLVEGLTRTRTLLLVLIPTLGLALVLIPTQVLLVPRRGVVFLRAQCSSAVGNHGRFTKARSQVRGIRDKR